MARRSEFPEYGAVREYHDDPYHGSANMKFSKICNEIKANISNINVGANSVEKLMRAIGTDRDSLETRDRIHEVSTKTNKIVQETTRQMRTIAAMTGLERQQKFQVDRLKNDFQDSVQRFTSLQKRAAEQVKKTVKLSSQKPKPKSSGGWMDDEDDEVKFLEQERKREEQQIQDQIIEDDLALIRDREERIRQLESDILDVNEIFKDLATLVNEQGETIDSIEANVDKAYTNVESGTSQLSKAAEYQRKSRKKMCILLVILVIIAAVVTIIIVAAVKS
ncbi:syntaxin-7-like [Saccostrea echinata]|uniref:syntaxin-7-like n=1 Tax=Saccostrea echinata TaxID=191078 RepID=UPI002A823929|nr:syntaxin-7-like [Saccostrea echinata]